MKKIRDERLETLKSFVKANVSEMVSYLKTFYNISDFSVKVYFSSASRRSFGGICEKGPFIRISTYRRFIVGSESTTLCFGEYAHIANNREIGDVKNTNWKGIITTLVAHEVAHALQFSQSARQEVLKSHGYSDFSENCIKTIVDGHGRLWQSIYAVLREKFVNSVDFVGLDTTSKEEQAKEDDALLEELFSEPETPVEAVKVSKPVRNKKWTVKSYSLGSNKVYNYYNSKNRLIGSLLSTKTGIFYAKGVNGKFEKSRVIGIVEARKTLLSI